MPTAMRSNRKLAELCKLIRAGAGELGIYALAAAAGRPYRRVHDQVQRLAVAGLVRIDKQVRGPRTQTRVRMARAPAGTVLDFNRAWSRPLGGVDADTVIAQVIARPTFHDLLVCAQDHGIARVRNTFQAMVNGCEIDPSAAAATARMLGNIEVGHARAAGIH
jgi:hypothetical protein